MAAVPASTFGPKATYTKSPLPSKPKQPRNAPTRSPLLHVVVRGVSHDIGDQEFLEALSPPESCPCGRRFVRAQRIVGRDDRPTGLVRVFMTCQTCCEALLKDGLAVHGRNYRVEAPHNTLIRPCDRCHAYGHEGSRCARALKLCRVCGVSVPEATKCDHRGHDMSRPYCATCNKYGHYTGQRHCPRYPRDPEDPRTNPPVRIIPPPAPKSNPWNLRLGDFPSLQPHAPLPTPAPLTTQPPQTTSAAHPTLTHQTPSTPPREGAPQDRDIADSAATPTPTPQPSPYITHDALAGFMDQLLTVLSEGFKRTFDALLTLLLTSAPAQGQQRVRDAVNSVTKRLFDTRTILQAVGSGLNVIHTNSKRPNHGSTR